MKAWEVRRGALAMHDVKQPRPGIGEVLITVLRAGLCGSDFPKLLRPAAFALPDCWRPGHEIVGIGPDGDPVAVDPLVPCQACHHCDSGETHLCPDLRRLGWDLPGGLAEQVSAPAGNVHALPAGLDSLPAVLADPAAVAIHGIRCNLSVRPGRLAVIGAGTIGLLTALYASQAGWSVTVVHRETNAPRAAQLRVVPAAVFQPSSAITDESFDAVIDAATGDDAAPLELAIRIVRDGGTVIVQNAYHPGVTMGSPLRDIFRRSIRLVGSFSYCRRHQPDDFVAALTLLRRYPLLRHIVTEAGSLTELPTVLVGQQNGRQVLTSW